MIEIKFKGKLPDLSNVDFKTPLDEIAQNLHLSIQKNFQTGGRPDKWRMIQRTGEPSHLYESGALYNSIGFGHNEYTAWAGVPIGSELPYSWIHQYGFGTYPQREYIKFQDEDVTMANEILLTHIVKMWDAEGKQIQ